MIYEAMSPPFEIENFENLSKRDANKHYDWYITQIPKRLEVLKRAFEFTQGKASEILDLSPESLIALWKWYITFIKTEPKTAEEIQKVPQDYRNFINTYKISIETLAIAQDISLYFATTLMSTYPELKWGIYFKPKTLLGVNRPVIIGFSTGEYLFVENLIINLTYKYLRGERNDEILYQLFLRWGAKISEKN